MTLTCSPSRERADRGERPGDHAVAALGAGEQLEVALAGDADLDRREHRASVGR